MGVKWWREWYDESWIQTIILLNYKVKPEARLRVFLIPQIKFKMKKLFFLFSALFLFVNTVYGQLPNYAPTDGLIGFWSFTQNANDDSGNNQNGTVAGAELTEDRFVKTLS